MSDSVRPWLRSFSQQVWGSPKPAPTYAGFAPLIDSVGNAPRGISA
jgi:hexosaminidase